MSKAIIVYSLTIHETNEQDREEKNQAKEVKGGSVLEKEKKCLQQRSVERFSRSVASR